MLFQSAFLPSNVWTMLKPAYLTDVEECILACMEEARVFLDNPSRGRERMRDVKVLKA